MRGNCGIFEASSAAGGSRRHAHVAPRVSAPDPAPTDAHPSHPLSLGCAEGAVYVLVALLSFQGLGGWPQVALSEEATRDPTPPAARPNCDQNGARRWLNACGKVQYSGEWRRRESTRPWLTGSRIPQPAPPNSSSGVPTHALRFREGEIPPPPPGDLSALHVRVVRLTRRRAVRPSLDADIVEGFRYRINFGHCPAPF